jgi:tripartite-type tricarboxylate transporter receptor subunit TctC
VAAGLRPGGLKTDQQSWRRTLRKRSFRSFAGNLARAAGACVLALSLCSLARAQNADADFFKGKTIRVIVPTPAGGLYDEFSRLIARHMARHIPDTPVMIVQNMGGAAGLVAANYMANVAPRDGLTIAAAHGSTMTAPILSPDAAKFDINTLSWLGSITKDPFVAYVWHTAPVQSLEDLKTKEGIFGGNAVGSASIDYAIVAKALFGFKIKIITGYANSTDVKLAMERGELHGTFGNGWSSLKVDQPDWVKDHKVTILTQFGLSRHPEMPDVPMFIDLAKNEADRQALELLLSRQEYSRPYYAPPQLAPARLAILRHAFDETMKDPGFLADAARIKAPVDGPVSGEEVANAARRIAATSPDVIKRVVGMFADFQKGKIK